MNFGEILSKAWKVIWKHKILWLFGLLAGCGAAGSGGGGGNPAASSSLEYRMEQSNSVFPPSTHWAMQDFFQSLADVPLLVWIAIGLIFILAVIVFSVLFKMLGTLGITGLVKGTSMADETGEDEKPLSLKAVFEGLKPSYWKVFLFNVGYQIAGFIVGLMLVLPIILLAVVTCGIGLLLMIPIGWLISVMVNFTTIAMVEEGLGVFKAISRAWQVLVKNIGNVLLMFLILGVGQIIIGIVLGLPIFVAILPVFINIAISGITNISAGLIITGILLIIMIPLMVFLGGVVKAYVWGAWTLTYRRLIKGESAEPEVLVTKETKDKAD